MLLAADPLARFIAEKGSVAVDEHRHDGEVIGALAQAGDEDVVVIDSSAEELERLEKDGAISQDDLARAEKELQKLTDRHTGTIDEALAHKERELKEI